ncbi:MAG: hypothetical protein HYY34_04395 [Chloroflexi bacterium]|nr:hypothetical protein [Chloroflexota bacterium]
MKPIGLGLPQLLVLALPAAVGGMVMALLIQGAETARYAAAVGVVVGLTYGIVVPALAAEIIAEARAVHAALRARAQALGIMLSNRMDIRGRRTAVTVVGAVGTCPLGFKPGDRRLVSSEGRLDRPLCHPAVAGITNRHLRPGPNGGGNAHCVCPIGGQMLTLKVQ